MGVENTTGVEAGTEVVAGAETTTVTPVSLKDDDLVELTVRGEKVVKPWKEARGEMQMQSDYTRSKQDLAVKAKELNDLYEAVKSREGTIAEKEAAIDRILGRQTQHQDTSSPDDVITRKDIQTILSQEREAMQKTFDSKLTESTTKAEQERLFQRWEDLTENAVTSLTKENPLLSNIPQLSLLLKREALADKPQSEAEMTAAIVKAGKKLSSKLDTAYADRKKEEAIRKQTLTAKGTEPAGGQSVFTPSKKTYGERGKVNWDDLEKDVLSAVEASEE